MKWTLLTCAVLWALIFWGAYEFVTALPQGALDCTIQMGCDK